MSDKPFAINQQRAEALTEIGYQLREQRERQGLSIESIAAQTKIQRRIIEAIELANLSILPEPVYVRSFIRQYANVLGLDGIALAGQFPVDPIVSTQAIQTSNELLIAKLQPLHLYALYALIIAASITGLSYLLRQTATHSTTTNPTDLPSLATGGPSPSTKPTPPSIAPSPIAPSPIASLLTSPTVTPSAIATITPSPSPSPTNSPSAKPSSPKPSVAPTPSPAKTVVAPSPQAKPTRSVPAASPVATAVGNVSNTVLQAVAIGRRIRFPKLAPVPAQPVTINLVAKEDAWVRVSVDGKVEFEGVITSGSKRQWAGNQRVSIRTGNAGGILAGLNGAAPKPLGKGGQVEEANFGAPAQKGGTPPAKPKNNR